MPKPMPADVQIVMRDDGYETIGPAAHLLCLGAGPADESFYSDKVGYLNISALQQVVREAGEDADVLKLPLSSDLFASIANIEISSKVLRHMTPERAREPILLVQMEDGLRVIDGHHRIHRLAKDGAKEVSAYVFVPEILEAFAVKWFKKSANGEWEPFDPANEVKGFMSPAPGVHPRR